MTASFEKVVTPWPKKRGVSLARLRPLNGKTPGISKQSVSLRVNGEYSPPGGAVLSAFIRRPLKARQDSPTALERN